MKKILLLTLCAVGLVSSYAFADGNDVTVKGTLIDNMCAGMHKADLATFVKSHEKTCVLKTSCSGSGFLLYSDGKVYKISPSSNAAITGFLKGANNKLDVIVMGDQKGDTIRVESIKNQ